MKEEEAIGKILGRNKEREMCESGEKILCRRILLLSNAMYVPM